MMAETVKKSRIVSDDDLEEALMQEFNMRLKTCLSSEGLNGGAADEEEEEEEDEDARNENHAYENIQVVVQSNGNHPHTKLMLDLTDSADAQNLCGKNKLDSVDEFIQIERECLTMERLSTPENDEEPESEVEHKPLVAQVHEAISAKDRMLLSTDSASCLLFTQTVTSPMLTPSDERVDFMKGFQVGTEGSEETSPPTTVSEPPIEASSTFEQVEQESEEQDNENEQDQDQDQDPTEPEVDQHDAEVDQPEVDQLMDECAYSETEVNFRDQDNQSESINNEQEYETQEQSEQSCEESENPDVEEDQVDRMQSEMKSPDLLRDVPAIEVTTSGRIEESPRALSTTPTDLENCKLPSVKSLKDQYIKTASSEATTPTSPKFEKNEMNQLKSLDIMKQISKFEQISPSKEEASTEMTETYVESSVVETVNGDEHIQQQVQKKKTKKKSRSHANEKENISVCDLDSRFYNVNVKSLCRSFGDLTKLPDDCRPPEVNNKSRAKSMSDIRQVGLPGGRHIENVFNGVNVKALKERFSSTQSINNLNCISAQKRINTYDHCERKKSSFSKFDALQKKNVLHVRSSDSSKAQEKFNGSQADSSNCKSCGKIVFQMEQMKAERSIWHKNCFRCTECNKQLTVDTYQSHEGSLYCKPHFKALFAPKAVEEDPQPQKPRKHELIIRENQPEELPPDVVRASDKPSLGLEELQSLNVKERFQVFEHHQEEEHHGIERTALGVNVKRSPSILSKLARFQAKGMDIGVTDEALNGIPIEESSTEEEREEEEEEDGEDADLVRAKRAQREKPFHFTGMSDVKSKWEHGEQNGRDERREERKQEIQNIRNRLFMGKQGKMKELYQQAVMDSESGANVKRTETIEAADTRSIKERFEKGDVDAKRSQSTNEEDEVYESEISKKSRSIFKELDANATKPPPLVPQKSASKIFRQMSNTSVVASGDVIKSNEQVEDITVETADIQQRFKFFETYKEPEKQRKQFRITPPREGQVKVDSPEREVYRDPEVIRAEERSIVEDSVVAVKTQTAKKMLNKFRQMEEDVNREPVPMGPKPLKRFTPPPEPVRSESESDEEASESMDEDSDVEHNGLRNNATDAELLEAQKAARAKQLRAKFEKWEANEMKREQNNGSVNLIEEFGEEQSQIESTKSLRARFESMKGGQREEPKTMRPKVNRFVTSAATLDTCQDCKKRVYPLEKISVHGAIYHKKCFKCMECHTILRMDSYSYNQGLLYCTPHFKRLFITKGNYDTAFGLEQHKEKWNIPLA